MPSRPAPKRRVGAVWLIAGILLLAAAVWLTLAKPSSFTDLTTTSLSASNLLNGVAEDWPVIRSVAGAYVKAFAAENLLPVFVLLLPALLLIAQGLSRLGKTDRSLFGFLARPGARKAFLAGLFGLTLAAGLAGHFLVIGHYPAVGDEFCYLFGADQLAAGKLTLESPPMRDHFQTWSIVNDGRWYSKVTVGWPLLLAAGRAVRLQVLLNPLLAALSVVLLFLIGEVLFGPEAGCLAALWGLVTPFVIILSGTLFPHSANAFLDLLYIYFLLRAVETRRRTPSVLAGLALAFLLLVRPADGGVLLLATLPLLGYEFLKAGAKRRTAGTAAVIIAFFMAGLGLLMAVNLVQNGHPFVFGYQKYLAEDAWGFGANGHTLLRGAWHTLYSVMRAGVWGVPFLGLFILVSIAAKGRRPAWLFLVPVAGSMALYAGYYTLAGFEYGPRYYLPLYVLALIPAAAGVLHIRDALARRRLAGAGSLVTALILSTVLFTAAGTWPRLVKAVKAQTPSLIQVSRLLNAPPVEAPSLIFLRDHRDLKNTYLTRNLPGYRTSRHIWALYLSPEENEKLVALFPDRKVYTTVRDPATGGLEFLSGVDDSPSALSYLVAGLNYIEFDPHKAVLAFAKALEIAPDQPTIMMNLARAGDLDGDRWGAVGLYARVLQSGETSLRDQAFFFLATDLRLLGRPDEALKVYAELAGSGADPSYRDRAAAWVEKLNR
jgi:tetratricopeptide (TPR) repeat protein